MRSSYDPTVLILCEHRDTRYIKYERKGKMDWGGGMLKVVMSWEV